MSDVDEEWDLNPEDFEDIIKEIEAGEAFDLDIGLDLEALTSLEDFLDFDEAGASRQADGIDLKFKPVNPAYCHALPEIRDISTVALDDDIVESPSVGVIFEKEGKLLIKETGVEVGVYTRPTGLEISYDTSDIYKVANRYAEEGAYKGAGMGFSMFLHSACCLAIARSNESILEPPDGHDIDVGDIKLEVTGTGYRRRVTKANWVLSKYRLLCSAASSEPLHEDYVNLSFAEDKRDPSMFRGTAFDQGESPYTPEIDKIMVQLRLMTESQMRAISNQYIYHLSNRERIRAPAITEATDSTLIKENFLRGLKCKCEEHHEDCPNLMMPAPFRVLSPTEPCRQDQPGKVSVSLYTDKASTYHTLKHTDDYDPYLWVETGNSPDISDETDELQEALLKDMCRFSSFQSAYIESELMAKINGHSGSFFSKYTHTGISWSRKNRNSLLWDCCYYHYSAPQEECLVGKWEKIGAYWRSPTFKISRNEIHFKICLPYRFLTITSSVVSLVGLKKVRGFFPKIGTLITYASNSSWVTSSISANSRFITCCHLAQSGDLQELVSAQTTPDDRTYHHRASDCLYFKMLIKYVESAKDYKKTPLLGLPKCLASLEKDMTLLTQWHIRGNAHETLCMTKLTKCYKAQAQELGSDIEWLRTQREYLESMMVHGKSQQDFDTLMMQKPKHVSLNVLMAIAFAFLSKPRIAELGARQMTTGFSIRGMASDHNMMKVEHGAIKTYTRAKVAEELAALLNKQDSVNGPYELLVNQMKGDNIEFVFGMHPKDQKHGNRDISQMHIEMRPSQYYTESMISVYNDGVEEDMMTDKGKYSKVVNSAVDTLSKPYKVCSSEDRANFCGHMQPEKMGIITYLVARVSGSTSLVSAASMQLVNTKRKVIYPMLFDNTKSPEPIPPGYETVWRKEKNVVKKVPCVTMHKHMMQGIYAGGGALVNTVFCYGINQAMERLIPELESPLLATTSDDVVRGYLLPKKIRKDQVTQEVIYRPHIEMESFMMENSKKKLIMTDNHIEFNNIVVTRQGMIPQSPIHGTLMVQPLLSLSPIGDIVSVWSVSAQSITWGDSPDLAQFATYGMARMLQQKWLFTAEEMSDLYACGLLPRSISEMIEGFFPRNLRVFSLFWGKLDEEGKMSVILGEKTLSSAFSGIAVKENKRRRRKDISTRHNLPALNTVLRTIANARVVSGRLNPRFVQQMPVARRLGVKRKFMNEIRAHTEEDPLAYKELLPAPVSLHFSKHTKRDSFPMHMGESASVASLRVRNMRIYKYCGVTLTTPLTDEEKASCELDDEEFEQMVQKTMQAEQRIGRSFESPSGLPLVSFADGRHFSKPVAFNFSYSLAFNERPEPVFAFRSREVRDFKPCMWGGGTLQKAWDERCVLALGYNIIGGNIHIYYCTRSSGTCRVIAEDPRTNFCIVETGLAVPAKVACVINFDMSTINPAVYGIVAEGHLSGVIGDNIAILNYGSYIVSSQPTGFKILQQIYRKFQCLLPVENRNLYTAYPWFKRPVELLRGNITIFEGNRSSRRVKLLENLGNNRNTIIDLTTPIPQYVVKEAEVEDFEEYDA